MTADFTITGQQRIAGQVSADGDDGQPTFRSVNPRTREADPVAFHNATLAEIDRAVAAAQAAYAETRHYPASRLARFMEGVAGVIDDLGEGLLATADRETALGIPRLTSERGRTTGQLRQFAALLREGSYVQAILDSALPDRQPAPRPSIRRMLFPIGPVAVFAASNFPLAFSVAGGDTASAFAAGCPVIVKAHPGHPATSELTAQAVEWAVREMGFPPGFFSLVQGNRTEVGQALVKHPGIAAVGFTGSLRAGRAIYNAAASRPTPIPVYAEMGSVNPVVVLPGAIASRSASLAEGLVASVTLGSGQYCTNPGLIFVIDGDGTPEFVDALVAQMSSRAPGVLLNETVQRGLVRTVEATLGKPGIERLMGGGPIDGAGYCFAHTVLQTTASAFRADPELQNEHFGPVTLIVRCESRDDLLAALEALHGSLTATIHTGDSDVVGDIEQSFVARVADLLREKVGRLIWNGLPTGIEVVYAMQHGGPYPATTAPATTSVGMTAIQRFMRPVAFQGLPDALLPDALKDGNPLGIWRIVDNQWTRAPIA
ncbi:MAG TPA: aldehyde dehydrogenase (NADP(+)) [Aggregatilineales bacterium]|nr:aldehyde dehydrogenase (NADP(+)) [Aggregatilineales bacterium]